MATARTTCWSRSTRRSTTLPARLHSRNAAGTRIDRTDRQPLVGIIQGGVNSPYGDGIYEFKKNAWQPRAGFAYALTGQGNTVLRSAFGVYYDQPLVGIFEQNSFTMPPVVNNVTFSNVTLANPAPPVRFSSV